MLQTLQQTKLKTLVKILLKTSFALFILSCNKMPLVTLNQLDTINNQTNPFRIIKYDKVNCKIEFVEEPSFPILSQKLNGAFCLTKEDFAKYKSFVQSECKNNSKESGN